MTLTEFVNGDKSKRWVAESLVVFANSVVAVYDHGEADGRRVPCTS